MSGLIAQMITWRREDSNFLLPLEHWWYIKQLFFIPSFWPVLFKGHVSLNVGETIENYKEISLLSRLG